jgi:hypothetical protein
MLKQLPFKKEYLLIAGAICCFAICYQLALKNTIAAWQIHKQLTAEVTRATDLSFQPAYLERKNANLNRIIGRYQTDTLVFRSNSLSIIAAIAGKQNVKLSEVPLQDPLFHTDKFIIQKLNFDGDYFSITKFLNRLQATSGIGMIRSIDYKITGIRSNTEETKKLMVEVYLELAK